MEKDESSVVSRHSDAMEQLTFVELLADIDRQERHKATIEEVIEEEGINGKFLPKNLLVHHLKQLESYDSEEFEKILLEMVESGLISITEDADLICVFLEKV